VLAASLMAAQHPFGPWALMDSAWLEIVQERSQFLFLPLWRPVDWLQNALPLLSLTLTLTSLNDARARALSHRAMLVAVTGMGIALVASLLPVPILLQAQTWRWVWISDVVAVVLLPETVLQLRRDARMGKVCAALAVLSWLIPTRSALACMSLALTLRLARGRIDSHLVAPLRTIKDFSSELARTKLGTSTVLCWLRMRRLTVSLAISVALLLAAALLAPGAFQEKSKNGTAGEVEEFSDWRRAIPPTANVLILPSHNSANFAWLTLQRPSYLTVDQSSGVVFSRNTALEVERRAEVLSVLMPPDWMLLSMMRRRAPTQAGASSASAAASPGSLPLSADRLRRVCQDRQLNFVVATESLGIAQSLRFRPHQGLHLYDCDSMRSDPALKSTS
jgi:hypothetical protein